MNLVTIVRKIRACEGEVAAQLLLEYALKEERERCVLEIKRMAKTKPYHPTKSSALYDAVNALLALDNWGSNTNKGD